MVLVMNGREGLRFTSIPCLLVTCTHTVVEKKSEDYTFWRQLNEQPSIMPGCPELNSCTVMKMNPWTRLWAAALKGSHYDC